MIHIKNVKGVLERVTPLGAAATLLLGAIIPSVALRHASAASLTDRSLMVTSTVASDDLAAPDGTTYTGLTEGDPRNGQKVGHEYNFKVGSNTAIDAFTIEYCEKAFDFVGAGACTATALLAGSPSFSAANWNGGTVTVRNITTSTSQTFNVTSQTANYLELASTSTALTVSSGNEVSIEFTPTATNYFVNPNSSYKTTSNGTYFAHIISFGDSADLTGAYASTAELPAGGIDGGTVTNNITTAIGIYTRVQETLNFSVEGDAASKSGSTPGTPANPTSAGLGCSPLTAGGQLKLGDTNDALEAGYANKVSSYFRLSTNSAKGTQVFYSGNTLSNTNHSFPTGVTSGAYANGVERFGLGINVDTPNTGVALNSLSPIAPYDDAGTNNSFAFDTGSVANPVPIAASTGGVSCDTGQVDYMASISPDTPAGIYQTKINYIASPKY